MSERTYIVAQLGARMHYAVPRILQESGQLERLYTDICAVRGWPRLLNLIPNSLRPKTINRLLSRVPRGVQPGRITAFNDFGYEYAKRRSLIARQGRFLVHLWAGEEFCRRILNAGFGRAGGVFTFNTAGLEILQRAKQSGLKAVTEQTIAPMRLELEILHDEASRFPGWEASTENAGASTYCDREEQEWKSADLILCGSEFVREGIEQCGGPVEKCVVVPYGVELPEGSRNAAGGEAGLSRRKAEDRRNGPLRVLTVGTVGLRKGSPYVLEAAKQLKGCAQFRLVGGIGVAREAEAQLREHLELTGPVPESELAGQFAWADVFLLPSLCEGSATVTYEALANRLPVICTANTGSVVRNGIEGFIVPIRDAAAIVERLHRFLDDSELMRRMSAKGATRAKEFTVAKYGYRLTSALRMSCSN
jgi:glycosyltransferase involved in cell wall biosynthesis